MFLVAFAKHGGSLEPWKTGNLTLEYVWVEEYVCCIFGSNKKSVDTVGADVYEKKWKQSDWSINYATMF